MSKGRGEGVAVPPLVATSRRRRLVDGDRVFLAVAYGAAALILLIAAIFIIALFIPALPAITKFGLGFFVSRSWDPVRIQFGALPAIYGTLVTSAIALVIAFPIGLGAALFLAEDARLRFLRGPLSFAIELLAGIPRVLLGLWAFFILIPLVRDNRVPFLNHTMGFLPRFLRIPSAFCFCPA